MPTTFSAKPVERGWLLESLDRLVKGEERTRVLVIDDDEVFRYVVRQELTTDNIRVLEAATGSHGLERVGQERFDLVLLDLDLPDISGYEVLRPHGARQARTAARRGRQRYAIGAAGTPTLGQSRSNRAEKRNLAGTVTHGYDGRGRGP